MDYIDNQGKKIGSLTVSISNDKSIVINRLRDVTTVSVRDRNTGKVSTETFFGDSTLVKLGSVLAGSKVSDKKV